MGSRFGSSQAMEEREAQVRHHLNPFEFTVSAGLWGSHSSFPVSSCMQLSNPNKLNLKIKMCCSQKGSGAHQVSRVC